MYNVSKPNKVNLDYVKKRTGPSPDTKKKPKPTKANKKPKTR